MQPTHTDESQPVTAEAVPGDVGVVRTILAGGLMGIANIIPGVSGGTIVLALGLYQNFVDAVADFTRLRFRFASMLFLLLLFGTSSVTIGLLSYPMIWALENIHHIMFALFIGLTLGGVPVILREIHGFTPPVIIGAVFGFGVMVALALAQQVSIPGTWIVFFAAGLIASAAMVLPGISGSYLLLIVGLYYPITEAIKNFISALKDIDISAAFSIGASVLLPVGLGVIVGVAGLTNGLKWLLENQKAPTMGALLGLLVGSVLGLYPFKALMDKGEVISEAHAATPTNIVIVIVAAVAGYAITMALARLGNSKATSHS
jgi:putative membrane protein